MASGPAWWLPPNGPVEIGELQLDDQQEHRPDRSPDESGEDLAYLWLEDSDGPVSDELGACRLALVTPNGGPPYAARWM